MTNVPDNIREMWKKIYILFDKHWNMDIHSETAWNDFWAEARDILDAHGDINGVEHLLHAVAEVICGKGGTV